MAIKLASSILVLSIKRLARGTFAILVNENAGRGYSYTTIEKSHVQVIKLASVILALSIGVLAKDTFA